MADIQLPPTIPSKGDMPKALESKTNDKAIPTSEREATPGAEDSVADGAVELDGLKITDRPRLKPPRTLETTLFDRLEILYGQGIKRVLNTQYR